MKRLPVRVALVFFVASTLSRAAVSLRAQNLEIPLIPDYDTVGDQIEAVQGYYGAGDSADQMWISWGIYDTGASVVTLSATDQLIYSLTSQPIPTKPGVETVAQGVNGSVIGEVSQPGYVVSDGLHIFNFDIENILNGESLYNWNLPGGDPTKPKSAVASNVQMFVGTSEGSEFLPTIAGTPIHNSLNHSGAAAARIDKQGYGFDLQAMFPEYFSQPYTYYVPDLKYVDSGTKLTGSGSTTSPVRIPLTLLGEDNHSSPGDQVTVTPNPFVASTRLAMGTQEGAASAASSNFLFDTGAMISLISPDIAQQKLKIDLDHYAYTLDVAGAAGEPITVKGYIIPLLELAYDNLDGISGYLQIKDAPFFVLDVGEGIDGILGMNLFNTAKEMLYDPYDPDGASLQLTFSTEDRVLESDLSGLASSEEFLLYSELFGEAFTSMFVHTGAYGVPGVTSVPEPGTFILLAVGASIFLLRRFVRRSR
jgi:hypothetical protein